MRSLILGAAVAALVLLPALASAEHHEGDTTAEEVKATIMAENAFVRENLMDSEGGVSAEGTAEFWSSGGLLQWVAPDAPASEYEDFSITPKHIKVITLVPGQAAVAMYYSEGSMHQKGSAPVGHYMTRVMQVWVKEDGAWVVRAAHWSPIAAGAGTNQTAIE